MAKIVGERKLGLSPIRLRHGPRNKALNRKANWLTVPYFSPGFRPTAPAWATILWCFGGSLVLSGSTDWLREVVSGSKKMVANRHRPTKTLDTPAILKRGTAETGMTLGEREKNDETNPISYNPQGINGLRLVSGTVDGPAQQNLTDRSSWIRGHRPKGARRRGTATGRQRTIGTAK